MSDIESIFIEARSLRGEGREAYLKDACGGDGALRKKVEHLLKSDLDAGSFLSSEDDDEADEADATPIQAAPNESAGQFIDRYKLLQQIGEGGFGTVWMAEQKEPIRRRVALKIIKLGMDTRQVIARFEAERQALAMMDHTNIARVLDAGATDAGRPYFVMELVRGIPILQYCDEERLDTRARLKLFKQVCNAIQHAHQKGIIHRDIKPSNVLVTLHGEEAVVKVIDFGIAKATSAELTQKTLFTEHRQMIGTPAYMSPEQAAMSGLDIDTRSDVYSLGVLLYELLTGTTPFNQKDLMSSGFAEMMRIIREVDSHKPSTRLSTLGETGMRTAQLRRTDPKTLRMLLRGDLDWIVMKCLEKDRSRRYETANILTADIERHLAGEPVIAAPPSRVYRTKKFVRRNRASVVTVGAISALLILGAIGTSIGMAWAIREKDRADAAAVEEMKARHIAESSEAKAQAEAERAERRAYHGLIVAAEAAMKESNPELGRRYLDDAPAHLRRWEWSYLRHRMGQSVRAIRISGEPILSIRLMPNGRDLMTLDRAGILRTHDFETEELVSVGAIDLRYPTFVTSDDGSLFVLRETDAAETVRIFAGCCDDLLWQTIGYIGDAPFSPDMEHIAISVPGNGLVMIYHSRTGREVQRLNVRGTHPIDATFSGDGRHVYYRDRREPFIGMIDLATAEETTWQPPVAGERRMIDGRRDRLLVADEVENRLLIYDLVNRELIGEIDSLAADAGRGGLSSDGRLLVARSPSTHRNVVHVFDLGERRHVAALRGHTATIVHTRFSPDGRLIYSSDRAGEVRVWNVPEHDNPHRISFHDDAIRLGAAHSPDDDQLAVCGGWGSIQLWNIVTGELLWDTQLLGEYVEHLAFRPDGALIAATETRGDVLILSAASGEVQRRYAGFPEGNTGVAWTPDGATLLLSGGCGRLAWIDAADGSWIETLPVHDGPISSIALSHQGDRLIATSDSLIKSMDNSDLINAPESQPAVAIVDVDDPAILQHSTNFSRGLTAATFSPDGSMFAVGDSVGQVYLFGSGLEDIRGTSISNDRVKRMLFSSAGDRLVVGGFASTVTVIDVENGMPLLNLPDRYVFSMLFRTTAAGDESLITLAPRTISEHAVSSSDRTLIEERSRQREIRRIADELYRKYHLSEDVLASPEVESDVPEYLRDQIRRHVRIRGDHVVRINSTALLIARSPDQPAEEYRRGLRLVDFLGSELVGREQSLTMLRALLHYRLGEIDRAADHLNAAVAIEGLAHVFDLSIAVLIERARGRDNRVAALLELLEQRSAEHGRGDQTERILHAEVQRLLHE